MSYVELIINLSDLSLYLLYKLFNKTSTVLETFSCHQRDYQSLFWDSYAPRIFLMMFLETSVLLERTLKNCTYILFCSLNFSLIWEKTLKNYNLPTIVWLKFKLLTYGLKFYDTSILINSFLSCILIFFMFLKKRDIKVEQNIIF